MASNLRAILELTQETTLSLGEDYANWLKFLRTASRNYKYSFADQLLIYAQKPEAVACAELKFWNRQFGRLVNRNSKGIALIDDSSDRLRLRYVFDVSDTHSPSGEEIGLWQMQEDYAWDVKAALEQRFGRLQGARDLPQVLRAVAKRAAEQNVAEYAAELVPYAGNGEQWEFEQTVAASVEYMLLNRCDLDTAEFASDWAMPFLHKYNKISSVTVLGCAVSDISEIILREIERKVLDISKPFGKTSQWHRVAVATAAPEEVLPVVLPNDKQIPTENRTFANAEQLVDNVSENIKERSEEYGHKLQTDGGLSAAGTDTAGAAAAWEVWQDEERVPEELPQGVLHNPAGGRQTDEPFAGGGEQGEGAGAAANRADGEGGRFERGSESKRADEVGRRDEQYPPSGAGAGDERDNLQLNKQGGDEELPPFVMPENASAQLSLFDVATYGKEQDNPLIFSPPQGLVDEVLISGSNQRDSRKRICAYFKKDHDTAANAAFLQGEFAGDGYGIWFSGERYTAWFAEEGIKIARGRSARYSRNAAEISWEQAARRIGELLSEGKYMPQSELNLVDEWERRDLADKLWFLYRDEFENIPDERKTILQHSGYPKDTQEIMQWLTDDGKIAEIAANIRECAGLLEEYPPRFRIMHQPEEILGRVQELLLPQREFVAVSDGSFAEPRRYISEDEIDKLLGCGSSVSGGKRRIYDFFREKHTLDEQVRFLKDEYGIGGFGRMGEDEWHDAKGIKYSRGGIGNPYDTITLSWDKVAKRIAGLIAQGRYIQEEQAKVEPEPAPQAINATNFHITDDELGTGGAKEKFQANVNAIKLLQHLEQDGVEATAEQQEVLARYVGWGGLPEAFDESNTAWQKEYAELGKLLSDDEYSSARASTLNAHYTQLQIIRAMYKALENMGFRGGNILEPALGVGNFFGMLPDEMQNSKLYGVELDSVSGRIAKKLYPKANIEVGGFEDSNLPDNFFDVAVGNVPFGNYFLSDSRYNRHHFLIHDYFFAKALDKVRPGGVIAFVTSKGTMDKQNSNVRKYLAERAELLGAIRLPNNAFKANAGAEVVSDIIFLQKRERIAPTLDEKIDANWLDLAVDENGCRVNRYFAEHPEMVLGKSRVVSGRFGEEVTVEPYADRELAELLDVAIQNIKGEIKVAELAEVSNENTDRAISADMAVRNFSFTVLNDDIYFRENSLMYPVAVSKVAEGRIRGLIAIRDSVRHLIELQTEDMPDGEIVAEQQRLNHLYDSFTAKYGLLNSRGNSMAFADDSSYPLLCSLEVLDEKGRLKSKADMFTKRTIKPKVQVAKVDTASEALAVSLAEKAKVDMQFMASLTGKGEQALAGELRGVVFRDILAENDDEHIWQTADEFLSGNVRQKLREYRYLLENTEDNGEDSVEVLQENVAAFERVQPEDLGAGDISVRLGATWLPEEVPELFMYELLGTSRNLQNEIRVSYVKMTGEWHISGKRIDRFNPKSNSTYGTGRINAYKIIEDTLNQRDVKIFDVVTDEVGKEKRVLNKKETAIAQGKQEQIKQAFKDWVWQDKDRRNRLVRIYNERFNAIRPREYDGSHIRFSGMNPEITLRKHQINAIAHIMYGGNTLLAHEVGAGKTYEMVAAAMESKRLGLCSKSMVVVPNHIVGQFAAEWLQLYPAANILVASERDFETKRRKKFCGRIATGDYDAVIIGHSQLEKIPLSVERQKAILEQQMEEIMEGIREAREEDGDNFTVKAMERTKKSIEAKLKKLNDQSRKDDVVTFEELGVDRLFVDEAHYFKNLFFASKMRNVSGVAQSEAQKSSDLFMKCRYLDELTNSHGVVLATGTPISNSMVELYTMQRYLQYDMLERTELIHFDAWAANFGETVTAIELAPEGSGYRPKTRFAKFYNLPELMSMFRCVADIQTADMLDLPTPKVNFHTEVIKPSDLQQEMVADLADRAERIRNGGVDPSLDNMLKITNDGRKLALDQRLIESTLPDDANGKVAKCAENVFRIWKDTAEQKSAQLVFCDLSTPKNDGTFNVYDDLRHKLENMGVPADEIAYIHNAKSKAQKQELFAKVRSGEVRVLIGSTAKMGAGTNVQQKLVALHDLDCPWRPADLQQRLGRIARQGNENEEVEVMRYVTEGTFDSYLYQLLENKQRFISQIMTGKSPVRVADDVDEAALSYAEIKALATGNPYIIEKSNLEIEVSRLNLLKSSHLNQQYALEDDVLTRYPREIQRLQERVAGYTKDAETVAANTAAKGEFMPMTVQGVCYSERMAAGKALLAACNKVQGVGKMALGNYRGFAMELSYLPISGVYSLALQGNLTYTVELGGDASGNISRIDNTLANIAGYCEETKARLLDTEQNMQKAKEELGKPFPQEEELAEKNRRLAELNVLLNLDEKESVILGDDEPDQEQEREKEKARGEAR